MDTAYRLKVKVGSNEFDAEGNEESVKEQFALWKEMIAAQAYAPALPPITANMNATLDPVTLKATATVGNGVDELLTKIMGVDGRVVFLTIKPESAEDAVLLLMYGQKVMRQVERVTGSEIVDGAAKTGGIDLGRTNRLFDKLHRDGVIMVSGERRGRKYQLTATAAERVRKLAGDYISKLA